MEDLSVMFPVEPIVGWTTTNYRDRSKHGEVQQMQGFKGCDLDGKRLPSDFYDQNMVAVPEGRFHTGEKFFLPTPDLAIESARKEVARLRADADRIEASIRRVEAEHG